MKKKLFLSFLTTALISFMFASCDSNDSPTNEQLTAKEFLSKKRDALKQELAFNTSQLPKTFTLKNGSKITIENGTFTKNGVAVTGDIKLEVYEALRPSDIISLGTNTNYNGSMGSNYLETDGFLYINAKQNGNDLDKSLVKDMKISIPTNKPDGTLTQLWKGSEDAKIDNKNQFGWVDIANNDIVGNRPMEDNIKEFNNVWAYQKTFSFSFGKLGWVNCDVIANTGKEKTTVTVKLTGVVGELASYQGYAGDTFVFFCQKGAPIVAQLYTKVDNTTVKSYDNTMPVGSEGKFIAFTISDKNGVSFATQDIKVTKGMSLTLNLQKTTKEMLDVLIKSLDGYSGK